MGLLSLPDFFICSVALHCLATCFLGWVLWVMCEIVEEVWRAKKTVVSLSTGLGSDDVLCPVLFKRLSPAQFIVGCTLSSIAFLFLSALGSTIEGILYFALCSNCQKDDELPTAVTLTDHMLASGCRSVGYLLMFVTHFERLRLTFTGTIMQLPKEAPKVLYVVFTVAILLIVALQLSRTKPVVTAVLLVFLFAWYLLSVSALIRAFYKRTLAITNDSDLMNAAVRITLCVTVALLSTAISLLLVSSFFVCPRCLLWTLFRRVFLRADMCLNSFSMLCTFRQAQSHYQRVFGRLHTYLMARVSIQTNLQLCESVFVAPLSPTITSMASNSDCDTAAAL